MLLKTMSLTVILSALLLLAITPVPAETQGERQGYLKASNAEAFDSFGKLVLSGDGNTLVVGSEEASKATGINGDQSDNSAVAAGAAYVFVKNKDHQWQQQAYLKASNTGESDRFGDALAISADGNVLAIGATRERSNATGINGNQADDSAPESGAVYIFRRNNDQQWQQEAYIKASNTEAKDLFGQALALSGDGQTLVVGAKGEDSDAIGENGTQDNNNSKNTGAVYIYKLTKKGWRQTTYLKPPKSIKGIRFGASVSLNQNGKTVVIGAPYYKYDSNKKKLGTAYIYSFKNNHWHFVSELVTKEQWFIGLGDSVSISADGDTAAVGASGVGAARDDPPTNITTGAAFIFQRQEKKWVEQAHVLSDSINSGDSFGNAVDLTADGNILLVGAAREGSSSAGINSIPNTKLLLSGAAYLFERDPKGQWKQTNYLKSLIRYYEGAFGRYVAIDDNGNTIAISAEYDTGINTGVAADPHKTGAHTSGAAHTFSRNSDGAWVQGVPSD